MRNKFFSLIIFLAISIEAFSQEVIYMTKEGGVFTMPCEVNGLKLRFIFDTGASDVSISMSEAMFMLKNGYLSKEDIKGSHRYRIANGDVVEGTTIILRQIKIGSRTLYNVEASIVHSPSAPLLLGQSALNKLGKFSFDYSNNTLALGGTDYSSPNNKTSSNTSNKTYTNSSSKSSSNTSNTAPSSSNYDYNNSLTTTLKSEGKLKSSDSPHSKIIKVIPKGATVRVYENKEGYWRTSYNGNLGYLHDMYLNITYEMSKKELAGKSNTLALDLNNNKISNKTTTTLKLEGKLKDENMPLGKVIKYIPKGATVSVLGNKEDYWIVFYDGKTGYLHDMYININRNMILMKNK